jgi:hypothetical protein
VDGGAPTIVNNTIALSDSNGIFLASGAAAVVMNNIISRNGSRGARGEGRRGRGICNFTAGSAITYNVFHRNRKAALLQGGRDFRRIRAAQRSLGGPLLAGNLDKNPRFERRRPVKTLEDFAPDHFELRANSRILGTGNPDPLYRNADGSPNTPGHRGGPLAAP